MDEISTTRQSIAGAGALSTIGAGEVSSPRSGIRNGDAVIVGTGRSALTDMQEEIGNSVGKLADKRTLQQSKIRLGAGSNREAITRIADYLDRLPDAPRESKLLDLVNRLQSYDRLIKQGSPDQAGAETILQLLRDTGTSPRQQYMLLRGASMYLGIDGASSKLLSLLDRAENSFRDNKIAYDVRADYAMLAHAKKAAVSSDIEPGTLRDKYRELLLSGKNLGQLFYSLSDFYKRLRFHSVIELFLKAAGDDLNATTHDTDRIFLNKLLKELNILKTMNTVYESCSALIERIYGMFPDIREEEYSKRQNEFTGTLLSFCASKTTSIEDGRKVIKSIECDETTPIAMVVFGNGVLDLHRDLPGHIFPSDQDRRLQVDILQDVCDGLVENEERAYEAASLLRPADKSGR